MLRNEADSRTKISNSNLTCDRLVTTSTPVTLPHELQSTGGRKMSCKASGVGKIHASSSTAPRAIY